MKISEYPKDTVVILYEWWAGNCNMGMWTARLNGEVLDYHLKKELIRQAKEMELDWMVLKHHKGKDRGKISIVEQSKKLNLSKKKQQ